MNSFIRNKLLIGEKGLTLLKNTTVCIVGIGGVGSFTTESLARSGIGTLILIDKDNIDVSNINRQLHATTKTIGMSKVEVMKNRILEINPKCNVIVLNMFYLDDKKEELFKYDIDYLVDACDTVSAKISLIKECLSRKIKFISSMGAANKSRPELFNISDLSKTKVDPLAKVIRIKLKKLNIKGKIPVVYSEESPYVIDYSNNKQSSIRKESMPPSSNAFCPSVAGLLCGSFVYNDILSNLKLIKKED